MAARQLKSLAAISRIQGSSVINGAQRSYTNSSSDEQRTPTAHEVGRETAYTKNQGLNRSILAALQQEIKLEPDYVKAWYARKQREHMKKEHSYVKERHRLLGPDLATAHFVVARGGSVKFVDKDEWIDLSNMESKDDRVPRLPGNFVKEAHLEAVDATDTTMMYESFDNFVRLRYLRYLNLSRCKNIDDFCLDRMSQFSSSLVYLDLSGCDRVTERGLATLHRLRKLKRLRIENMNSVDQIHLVVSMLSVCMPNCAIEFSEDASNDIKVNKFVQALSSYADKADKMHDQ